MFTIVLKSQKIKKLEKHLKWIKLQQFHNQNDKNQFIQFAAFKLHKQFLKQFYKNCKAKAYPKNSFLKISELTIDVVKNFYLQFKIRIYLK